MNFSTSITSVFNFSYNRAYCDGQGTNYLMVSGQYLTALSSSMLIDSGANWGSENVLGMHTVKVMSGGIFIYSTGNFSGEIDKFVGLKFRIDSNIHYGWVQLDVLYGVSGLFIKSYAYNDVPNQSIMAGQTETVSLEDNILEDVSIYGYNNQVSISGVTKGTVTIYDLMGQEMQQAKLNGNTSIRMNKRGIYLVKVNSEGKSISKKVYLNN
ncbi:MAG: T9SS type A sorting domain-containing protein [Bacteroidetes bacterium]|nr:T9SS type A sorting domain-containing protein [Bacteroidota bacterium]